MSFTLKSVLHIKIDLCKINEILTNIALQKNILHLSDKRKI